MKLMGFHASGLTPRLAALFSVSLKSFHSRAGDDAEFAPLLVAVASSLKPNFCMSVTWLVVVFAAIGTGRMDIVPFLCSTKV